MARPTRIGASGRRRASSLVPVLVLALAAAAPIASAAEEPAEHARVREAIARLAREELRASFVRVELIDVSVKPAPAIRATADDGARTGSPARFLLWHGSRRIGSAVARVEADGLHVVSTRPIARGDVIAPEDVAIVTGGIEDQPLRPLPAFDDVVGAHARRAIAAGETLTAAIVKVPPAVRSGEAVRVTVRAGAVEASGIARASGSGGIGDEIRVIRPGSRQLWRARITGPGQVEIVR